MYNGLIFWLPGPDVLTKEEWDKKIKEFLYEQLEEERGLTACLIIHTCNKNRDKVYFSCNVAYSYVFTIKTFDKSTNKLHCIRKSLNLCITPYCSTFSVLNL